MELSDLARAYIEAREIRLAADDVVKEKKQEEAQAKEELIKGFIDAGANGIDIVIGAERKKVSVRQDLHVNIKADDMSKAVKVCDDLGLPEMIDPRKVNTARLKSFVIEREKDSIPLDTELAEILSLARIPNISVTKK